MTRFASIVLLTLFVGGCAYLQGPENNKEFYQISQLTELAGVYKNEGDPRGYLSNVIWNETKPDQSPIVSHKSIELIEVSSTENMLAVKAIQNGCAIFEKSYFIGRDIKITDGRIFLSHKVQLVDSDGWVFGPEFETIALGLDEDKQGKYRRSNFVVGLSNIVLAPVSISNTSDIRFDRVSDKPQGYQPCHN